MANQTLYLLQRVELDGDLTPMAVFPALRDAERAGTEIDAFMRITPLELFNTFEHFQQTYQVGLREQALAKLTEAEKRALGLSEPETNSFSELGAQVFNGKA